MDILTFKSAKDQTEATLEECELLEEAKEFLQGILDRKQHLEGETLIKWRRLMRTA